MFSTPFLGEIVSLALDIAFRKTGVRAFRPLLTNEATGEQGLYDRFDAELKEFQDATQVWDELPDLGYYMAQIEWHEVLQEPYQEKAQILLGLLEHHKVTLLELEAATLAKYRRRAAGMPKNVESERREILESVKLNRKRANRKLTITLTYVILILKVE